MQCAVEGRGCAATNILTIFLDSDDRMITILDENKLLLLLLLLLLLPLPLLLLLLLLIQEYANSLTNKIINLSCFYKNKTI